MAINELLKTVHRLRNECPWDKKQTHQSLTPYLIEEAYEAYEAILSDQSLEMKDELGDVLFQVLLHAEIASETERFQFEQVCDHLNQKLIRRHPHVFGETSLSTSEEVLDQWQEIKKTEKSQTSQKDLLDVSESLPTFLYAEKLSGRVARQSFDWENSQQVLEKVTEELDEMKSAQTKNQKEEELGDLLFALVNYARHEELNADVALRKASLKFQSRYRKMRDLMDQEGVQIEELTLEQKESYWQKAKKEM